MSLSSRQKQRIGLIIGFVVLGYYANQFSAEQAYSTPQQQLNLEQLIEQKQSDVQINLTAQVSRLLGDDLRGSRHQRFLIELAGGETILIAHNIDLAPKIKDLKKGDIVTLYGEYEWNKKGGVIHWTHHDPAKRHIDGWIEHNGHRYQ